MDDKGSRGKCCCVTNVDCEAPANTSDHVAVRTRCWACGDFVCKACSRVRRWAFARHRVRICDRCAEDADKAKAR